MDNFRLIIEHPEYAILMWGIVSAAAGYYLYQDKLTRWMNQRKIEAWHQERRKCPVCGKKMVPAITKAESKKVWCCSNWQKCKTYIEHHTGERLSAAEIERTDGKAAL